MSPNARSPKVSTESTAGVPQLPPPPGPGLRRNRPWQAACWGGGAGGPGPNWGQVPGRGGEGTRSCRGVLPSGQGDRGEVDSSTHTSAKAGSPSSPPDCGTRGERTEQTGLLLKARAVKPRETDEANYHHVTTSPGAVTSETRALWRHRAPSWAGDTDPPPHPPQLTEVSAASPGTCDPEAGARSACQGMRPAKPQPGNRCPGSPNKPHVALQTPRPEGQQEK